MFAEQVFDDQWRRWESYWIHFYLHEFLPPNPSR
ncbi:MAG: hypothetical protein MRERC_5c095 [Mycoplasmataceae bacterium RC_NB112A]|nr:MAG: hypothetical protein MRERC_5c095 [Mycoplasmataceae bacterium RC_NB112A]